MIMKKNTSIVIFGYAFPHRKTCDFITILFALGFQNITIIGAPKLLLKSNAFLETIDENISNAYDVKNLCSSLKINFEECAHDDVLNIGKIKRSAQANIAIISGARIIRREVIDLFSDGVVNFHPGKIPETSGLDSFYYTIKNNCSMGVTVHCIDQKVDAGKFILFEMLKVNAEDSIDMVRENLYGVQLIALRRYLTHYFGAMKSLNDIFRPIKNPPLSAFEKENIKLNFLRWRDCQVNEQESIEECFFNLCKKGDLAKIKILITSHSYLLHCKNSEGWTAIIISTFWQRLEVVRYLIGIGANPNDTGRKGTSVLMYAKTKLLNCSNPDLSLIKFLLESGANINQKDCFGENIFYYLNIKSNPAKIIRDYLITAS